MIQHFSGPFWGRFCGSPPGPQASNSCEIMVDHVDSPTRRWLSLTIRAWGRSAKWLKKTSHDVEKSKNADVESMCCFFPPLR